MYIYIYTYTQVSTRVKDLQACKNACANEVSGAVRLLAGRNNVLCFRSSMRSRALVMIPAGGSEGVPRSRWPDAGLMLVQYSVGSLGSLELGSLEPSERTDVHQCQVSTSIIEVLGKGCSLPTRV